MNAADAILGPALERGLRDAPALIHEQRRLTYGEVLAMVDRIGHGLRGAGVARGQRVLLLLKDAPELVCAYLATLKIGAVAVPINPRAAAEELLFYLADSRARVLVLDAEYVPLFRRAARRLTEPLRVYVLGSDSVPEGTRPFGELTTGSAAPLRATPMSPADMAFWIYTSGTTGAARAAVHAQQDVLASDAYLRETLGVGAGTRLFATSKLFFAYALGTCLFGGLRLGATTILHSSWPNPAGVLEVLRAHRPDIVFSVPALFRSMLRAGIAGEEPFRSVRTWVSAGEKLPEVLYSRWAEATGAAIVEGIGTSETIYMFLTNRPGDTAPGSAGYPAPQAQVRLVDDDGAQVTRPGEPGMLQVRMASTCARYWNQPACTPAVMDGGWFSTGDRFTFDERGRWNHKGRRDDMLQLGGQWANPAEIEDCVLALPEVADAAAIGVNDGDGPMRLVLYAVPARAGAAGALLEETIRGAIGRCLEHPDCRPHIRMVPELPRTASGKVQRFRLRQELAAELARSGT